MPVIRSAVRSVSSDAIREAVVSPWRYFSTFDPVLNTYGELDTAVTFSGDFEVEVLCYSDVSTTYGLLSDATGTNYLRLKRRTNGSTVVQLKIDGTLYSLSGLTLDANKLISIRIVRTGTSAELFLNGVSQSTTIVSGNDFVTSLVGRRPATDYFDGIITNVKLTDLVTPANSRIFPVGLSGGASVENSTINSGSVTYYNLPSSNQERFTFDEAGDRWVGDELWDNDTAIASGDWSYVGGGVFDINGSAGTLLKMSDDFDFITESKFTWTQTSGEIRLGNVGFFTTSGSNDYTVVGVDSSSYGFKRNAGTVTGSLSDISVKRLLELA